MSIYKSWMFEDDIFGAVYRAGVKFFIEYAADNGVEENHCPCPCRLCRNKKHFDFQGVKKHLETKGVDKTYTTWIWHGEKQTKQPVNIPRSIPVEIDDAGNEEELVRENAGSAFPDFSPFIDAAFPIEGCVQIDDDGNEEPCDPDPDVQKRNAKYKELVEQKLYPICKGNVSTLSAIVELHNIKKQFGISGNCVSSLLEMIKGWLPEDNTLPVKYSALKSVMKDLGMNYRAIHACPNHCFLYYDVHELETSCPTCNEPRYKVKRSKDGTVFQTKEPALVLRYFGLEERFRRWFSIPWIAAAMTWHDQAEVSPENMRHPIDSPQWALVKRKFPDFAQEGRNVWLGVSTDGFNPHGNMSLSWSCWPVMLVMYNLPPSLCMKSEFQILSLLIPGRKSPSQDFDVFLPPLVDELKAFWVKGRQVFDAHRKEQFLLKACLLWGIHDYPAQGIMSGCTTHGYCGCVVCADKTRSVHLSYGNKIIYNNYRLFLKSGHPFRRKGGLLGQKTDEAGLAPLRLTGEESLEKLALVKYKPGKSVKRRQLKRKTHDPVNEDEDAVTGAFYRESIFWNLEVYSMLRIRHCIDVMHTEKNVMEHIMEAIFDNDDSSKSAWTHREQLEKLGLSCGVWVTGADGKPTPAFALSKAERTSFCKILKDMKFPSGFVSNISSNVNMEKLRITNLKSHDNHVIMCYLLPILLQHAFPQHRDLRTALHQISLFFRILCSKVMCRADVQDAKFMVAEAMCVLEKYFPASFFDISVHLMVHLADEALQCGPVRYRWMYPFERAMKECKNQPSNKRFIEGCIAKGRLIEEGVRHAMECMPEATSGNHKQTWEAFLNPDSDFSDVGPMIIGNKVKLSSVQFVQIRRWVLFKLNPTGLDGYYSEFCDTLIPILDSSGKEVAVEEVVKQTKFIPWLVEKLLEEKKTAGVLWRLAQGPVGATEFLKYRINGWMFCPKSYEEKRITQDSGVCAEAYATFRRKNDKAAETRLEKFYGVINQILELNYTDFRETVFYCEWVKVETTATRICDESHLVLVKLNKLRSSTKETDEPVILAEEAKQVWYSKDLKSNEDWIATPVPKRLTKDVDNLEKPIDGSYQNVFEVEPHLRCLLDVHGNRRPPRVAQRRRL